MKQYTITEMKAAISPEALAEHEAMRGRMKEAFEKTSNPSAAAALSAIVGPMFIAAVDAGEIVFEDIPIILDVIRDGLFQAHKTAKEFEKTLPVEVDPKAN